jgi:hypothetical protein
MTITQEIVNDLQQQVLELAHSGDEFFTRVKNEVLPEDHSSRPYFGRSFREMISAETLQAGEALRERLREITLALIEAAKLSPLVTNEDIKDAPVTLKKSSAALRLKRYHRWDTEVLHDEGTVLGVTRSGQSEEDTDIQTAHKEFIDAMEKLQDLSVLLVPGGSTVSPTIPKPAGNVRQYRQNTAFIIMQINEEIPELEDVKNSIKEVFKEFGIDAVRSDEIEHQDVITARILEEINTSEFLIADLTGERPSVYYEVGYAHALGKRPILFRKEVPSCILIWQSTMSPNTTTLPTYVVS